MKIKTCSRCNGAGTVSNQHVLHCGVPGGCYKCDMAGKVVTLTMAERVLVFIASSERGLIEWTKTANEIKERAQANHDRIVASYVSSGMTPRQREVLSDWDQRQLADLRQCYISTKKAIAAVRVSNKVTAQQCQVTFPMSSLSYLKKIVGAAEVVAA